MFGIELFPGVVLGLREGLEAFLVIAIMVEYLNKTNQKGLKKFIFFGLGLGILASALIGLSLFGIASLFGQSSDVLSKVWASGSSFLALVLITSFIYWMLRHRDSIVSDVHAKMDNRLSNLALMLLATIMVAREGTEIALFVFAAENHTAYFLGSMGGVVLAGLLAFLVYKSLLKVNLRVVFNITLFYLILQAGFMVGYSIHELLSYLKAQAVWDSDFWVFTKLFDLSGTILNHQTQPLGIVLYATVGWYSKPEIIQFIAQYVYTGVLLTAFFKANAKSSIVKK